MRRIPPDLFAKVVRLLGSRANLGRARVAALAVGAASVAVVAISLSLLGAGSAGAANIQTGFADSLYVYASPADQTYWLDKAAAAGAGFVRVDVPWATVARSKPQNPGNPNDPAYHWDFVDSTVEAATQAGVKPVFTIYRAPPWAEGKGKPNGLREGSWKPSPTKFAAFTHALARRYSGTWPDPQTGTVFPAVRYYEIWNEPNLSVYITPQWRHGKPNSPTLYARLLNAAYRQIKSVSSSNQVISSGTAPFGNVQPGGEKMQPLTFLRSLFCVHHAPACAPTPHLDVLAHHPIFRKQSPTKSAPHKDDVAVPNLGRIKRVLRAANRSNNYRPGGSIPLWVTEFWWETNPPDKQNGVSPGTQAHWIEQALYLFWKAGARVALNLQIRDQLWHPHEVKPRSYQTGVYFYDGAPKPSLTAFKFPFVTDRLTKGSIRLWGKSPDAGSLAIQRKSGGAWQTVKTLTVPANRVFTSKLHLRGGARLRAQAVGSGKTSLAWHQDP